MELTLFWYSHVFVITLIPSSSWKPLFSADLQFPQTAHTSASDIRPSADSGHCEIYLLPYLLININPEKNDINKLRGSWPVF